MKTNSTGVLQNTAMVIFAFLFNGLRNSSVSSLMADKVHIYGLSAFSLVSV